MRRPSDFFNAAIGLVLIIWVVASVDTVSAWEQSLASLVESSPPWVGTLLAIGYGLSLIYVLVVTSALVAGGKERRSALRDLLIVALGTASLVVILSFVVNDAWPYVLPEFGLDNPVPLFPVLRVAVVTSIVLVVGPYLTRPLRKFGWFAIAMTAIASVALHYGTVSHTVGSFGVGLFCAGLLLVIMGSPRGYPDPEAVSAALGTLGVSVSSLDMAPYQTWGVVRFIGRDESGPVDVKVHGRDAYESQRLARIWHTLWYRETSQTISSSRLEAVEHEALATFMAGRAGVRVPQLAAVGAANADLSLVAFRDSAVPFSEVPKDVLTDDLLVDAWAQVRLMHERAISHGSLDTSAVQVGDAGVAITDFALASLAAEATDQGGDVVALLFSLAVLVGEEKAVRSALAGLGSERLAAALPYVQVPAVSPNVRRLAAKPKKVMSSLSSKIAELTGEEVPEPVKLRRVTVGNLVTVGLLLLVASALIPLFTSVDYAEIWAVLQSSDWALLVLALLVGHLQFPPQATSTMFAVPVRLPFWPLLTLQTASQFVSLAIPSAAGRVAMNTAFLTKFGVSVPVAVAQGSIDGFSGFLVQVALLVLVVLFGDVDLALDIDTSEVRWLLVIGVVALIVVGVYLAVTRIKSLHDRVVPVLKDAWGAFATVLKEPSRALGLLGSNFVYWNVLGITLWITLQAVGAEINYGAALFVAAGTSLLAGFMPVPGGIGVAEATMTALLVLFGVDESVAFAVTATYRVITFYLPALEGFFGSRWLERRGYI